MKQVAAARQKENEGQSAAIALNVFRESVRDKVLYNLVLFAILMMGASYLIGQLTAGQDVKIIKDLGLSATSVFGLFIAVFIGIGLVSKEVERRSVYSLLAKPIHRYQLILGKYAGLTLTLVVNIGGDGRWRSTRCSATWPGASRPMTATGLGRAGTRPGAAESDLVLIFVELMIVTAIALFFSTFSTPMLSAALTFGLFVVGHFSDDLRNFDEVVDSPAAARLARGALLGAAESRAVRRQGAGRARPAGSDLATCALTLRVRRAVHRRAA